MHRHQTPSALRAAKCLKTATAGVIDPAESLNNFLPWLYCRRAHPTAFNVSYMHRLHMRSHTRDTRVHKLACAHAQPCCTSQHTTPPELVVRPPALAFRKVRAPHTRAQHVPRHGQHFRLAVARRLEMQQLHGLCGWRPHCADKECGGCHLIWRPEDVSSQA